MTADPSNKVIQHVREAVLRECGAAPSDSELLEKYLCRRDEASFEVLVHRHGPMVLGVCRRVLGNEADSEDAFQATFLVFVRKAASIRSRNTLGNWLYGVAHNTALKAKAMNRKRRAKEQEAGQMPRPQGPDNGQGELEALLDAELSRVPDKYRVPIVLCELEGMTVKDAALRLGLPQGTVASRLARGRDLLAKRLRKQGLTLPAGVLTLALSHGAATAGVPPSLLLTTANAAREFAVGAVTTTGAVSASVAALTEGVLRAMLMKKLMAIVFLVAALVLIGAGGTAYHIFAAKPPEGTLAVSTAPVPVKEAPSPGGKGDEKGKLPRSRALEQVLVTPGEDGKIVVTVPIGRSYAYDPGSLRVFDSKGNKIDEKTLKGLIRGETVALASDHGLAVDPLHFRVLKEGTLVFVLPPPDPRAQFASGGTIQGAPPNDPVPAQGKLPTTRPLEQVLVAADKEEKLVVKVSVTGFFLVEQQIPGGESSGVELRTVEETVKVDLDRVRVFDSKGNKIDRKALPKLLQGETVALAAFEGEEVDPLHFRVLKEGTLIFILPPPK
jgi:RNA polymerase sigma factor (sigma-70 family)